MNKRYTTLGTDVLDCNDYSIIATAKTDEPAQHIADEMNTAIELNEAVWQLAEHPDSHAKLRDLLKIIDVEI